jgi:hypothetical protein
MRFGRARTVVTQSNIEANNRKTIFSLFAIVAIIPILSAVVGCAGLPTGTKQTSSTASPLQLDPAIVNFGQVAIGKPTTQTVSISNTGDVAVRLVKLNVSDTHFTLTGLTTPTALAVGQSSNFRISVNPTTAGALTGTLTAEGNGATTPLVVNLSATGVSSQPQLSLNAAALNFGNVSTGLKATNKLVLTNAGAANLTISLLTLTGTDFSLSAITTPTTLTAGQSAQVAVTFSPRAAGSATGNLSIASNDPADPVIDVALSGTGTTAPTGQLNASADSVSFGSVATGTKAEQQIVLTNTGNAGVTISSITVVGAGIKTSGVEVPGTLNAAESAPLKVSFSPTTSGSVTGSITVVSNAANSPLKIAMTGTGAQAGLSISPNNLSFANVNAGSSSSKGITISNTGKTSVTLSQVSVSAKDFTVSGMNTPITLAAGQNASMNVTFKPSSSENVTGNITVASSQGANAVIAVSGSGVQPALSITPSTASFGSVTAGSPASQTIQLQNSGTGTLTVTQIGVTGSGFTLGTLTLPMTLSSGQTSNFNVQFNPATAGAVTGSVSVVSNAPNSPANLALSGTGVAATQKLTVSTTSIAFGNVSPGSSATQSVTLTNSGNSTVTVSQISEIGSGFSLTGASAPVTLVSGQKMTFDVVFSPRASGSVSGSVVVASNVSGSPKTITLLGTGKQVSHSVTLSWTTSSSTVSGYNIYRTTVSGSGYAKINSGLIAGLTYTDTTVQPGMTYYYVATAVGTSGNESTDSNQATAVVP